MHRGHIKILNNFPEELENNAQSLDHLGIAEVAWNWADSIKVIDFLLNNNYGIIGGDVYKFINGSLYSTFDSWYYNKNEAQTNQEFLNNSFSRAKDYVNHYHEKNGDDYYYSFVISEIT